MYSILAIIGSIIGIGVSLYIFNKKHNHQPMMCPRRANCDSVVTSKYGETFGIHNEIAGLTYYILILFAGMFLLTYPVFATSSVHLVLVAFSGAAVAFSAYLIFVQAFILRTWCMWCLLSACANVLILGAVLMG